MPKTWSWASGPFGKKIILWRGFDPKGGEAFSVDSDYFDDMDEPDHIRALRAEMEAARIAKNEAMKDPKSTEDVREAARRLYWRINQRIQAARK